MMSSYSLAGWGARVLAIAFAAFLALFSQDAWSADRSSTRAAFDVLVHLIPAGLIVGLVVLAWRRPWIGAAGFMLLSAAYAVRVGRLDWVIVIAGPMLVIALLYFVSGYAGRRSRSEPA